MARLSERTLRRDLEAFLRGPDGAGPVLQVSLFFDGAATATHRRMAVYAPAYALFSTHAPGGFIASGGTHWTWAGPRVEATHPQFARRLLRRACAFAYDSLSAPADAESEVVTR